MCQTPFSTSTKLLYCHYQFQQFFKQAIISSLEKKKISGNGGTLNHILSDRDWSRKKVSSNWSCIDGKSWAVIYCCFPKHLLRYRITNLILCLTLILSPSKIRIAINHLHVSSLKKCSTTAEPVSVCSKLLCIASFAVDFVVWAITCQHRIQRAFAGMTAKAFLK